MNNFPCNFKLLYPRHGLLRPQAIQMLKEHFVEGKDYIVCNRTEIYLAQEASKSFATLVAINAEGSPAKQIDQAKRREVWRVASLLSEKGEEFTLKSVCKKCGVSGSVLRTYHPNFCKDIAALAKATKSRIIEQNIINALEELKKQNQAFFVGDVLRNAGGYCYDILRSRPRLKRQVFLASDESRQKFPEASCVFFGNPLTWQAKFSCQWESLRRAYKEKGIKAQSHPKKKVVTVNVTERRQYPSPL